MAYMTYGYNRFIGACCSHLVTPLVYDESLSYYENICALMAIVVRLQEDENDFVSKEVFEEFVRFVELDQKKQTDVLKKYTDGQLKMLESQLIALIEKITVGEVIVTDPSTGFKKNINDALSHLYNDQRYWSASWDEIDAFSQTMTFDEWDSVMQSYTVKQLDLLFASLFLGHTQPRAETLPQDERKY